MIDELRGEESSWNKKEYKEGEEKRWELDRGRGRRRHEHRGSI
jgi:hypothetical protein